MEESGISPGVIGAIISVIMLIMVGFIRFLANAIIVIVFVIAAILPLGLEGQIENEILYAYSAGIAIIAVLFTTAMGHLYNYAEGGIRHERQQNT